MHLLIQVVLFLAHILITTTLLQVDPVLSRDGNKVRLKQNHYNEVSKFKAERYIGANRLLSPTGQV